MTSQLHNFQNRREKLNGKCIFIHRIYIFQVDQCGTIPVVFREVFVWYSETETIVCPAVYALLPGNTAVEPFVNPSHRKTELREISILKLASDHLDLYNKEVTKTRIRVCVALIQSCDVIVCHIRD